MANTTETITLEILAKDLASGNISKFAANLDAMARKGGIAGSVLQGVGQSLGQMLNPIALVSDAFNVVTNVVGDSIRAFEEHQKINAQTNAVLASTAGVANETASGVENLASSIARQTGISDEAIQSSENLLLTFTNIRNEAGAGNDIFTQTTQVLQDMSVALGEDASSAAIQLGKALNDPIRGLTALQRVGVSFTADQKKLIAGMVQSGNIMGAQKVILAELNTEFGGSAKAYGETLPGAMGKLNVAVDELEQSFGAQLAPAIESAASALSDFLSQGADKPLSSSVQSLVDAWGKEADAVDAARQAHEQMANTNVGGGDKSWLGLLGIEEHLNDLGAQLGISGAKILQTANELQGLGDAAGMSQSQLEDFVAAGFDSGKSLDDMRVALQAAIDAQNKAPDAIHGTTAALSAQIPTVNNIDAAWRAAAINIPNAIETAASTTHRLFKTWLQQDKQDLKALADDLAHDPKDKKRLLKWLPDAMKQAQSDLITAEQTGDANAIAEAAALVKSLDYQWQQLHATIRIGVGVTTGGAGGHRLLQHGGPVRAGEPVVVGETRPELFVPSVSGTVYPSVGAALGTTVINVNWHSLAVPTEAEGQRMAQVIAPHLERELRRRRTFA